MLYFLILSLANIVFIIFFESIFLLFSLNSSSISFLNFIFFISSSSDISKFFFKLSNILSIIGFNTLSSQIK